MLKKMNAQLDKTLIKQTFSSDKIHFEIASKKSTKYFHTWWNDPFIMQHVGFPEGLNISETKVKELLTNNPNNDPVKQTLIYTVYDAIKNRPIGEASYAELIPNTSARIGLKIGDKDYLGKGFGKVILLDFCTHLFEFHGLKVIYIDTLKSNQRALNLYKSVGATVDEVKEAYWMGPDKTIHDAVFLSLKQTAL